MERMERILLTLAMPWFLRISAMVTTVVMASDTVS